MQTLNKTELLTRLQEASQVSQDYIAASPQWVQIWVLVMTVVLLPSFLFAFKRTEARWIAMSLLQIAVFTPMLIFTAGASKFWGITHLLFWTGPMLLGFSAVLRDGLTSWYLRWLALASTVMAISLVFDVVDVYKFFSA